MGSQPRSIFALVDGNAFYASCEIAFNPSLEKRPVVVLSNNDGCIVAANQIAKNLNTELLAHGGNLGQGGFASATPQNMMFQPYFKMKWLLDKHQAAIFSSNYELYGDMSNRMHSITRSFALRQEIYSIDESFLDFTGLEHLHNLTNYGQTIRKKVKQDIGIPVAIGIAHSKTLAKLANRLAKKRGQTQDVLDLTHLDAAQLDALLSQVEVANIWGIGKRLSHQLRHQGILNAKNLKYADTNLIRKQYGVVVERIVRELRGESCLNLEDITNPKKQILSSRSFGEPIHDYRSLESSVIHHVVRAAEKLRQQNSVCHYLTVTIRTNPFQRQTPHYANSQTIALIYPSDDSILLTKLAKRALKRIWRAGFFYHKSGVVLSEISPKGLVQGDLFAPNPSYSNNPKQAALMNIIDQLNTKNGKGTIFLGAQGIQKKASWQMKRERMSPRYTTCWEELLSVK